MESSTELAFRTYSVIEARLVRTSKYTTSIWNNAFWDAIFVNDLFIKEICKVFYSTYLITYNVDRELGEPIDNSKDRVIDASVAGA
jgi:hypothetical protein